MNAELGAAVARWFAAAAFDGTVFAALCWLTSITLLRRAGGRLLALLWLAALLRFVVWGPLELHAVPLAIAPDAAPAQPSSTIALWLVLGYAAVLCVVLARALVRQQRLRRSVAALPPASAATIECVRQAARQLSLRNIPSVRTTHASIPPFCIGTMHPVLVLPGWLCEPGPRLHAVLLHELAHLERRDHFTIWIERAIAYLFFVWPPVHWIARKLQDARELACDERAIERGGFTTPEYASHLLDVVARTRGRVTRDALAMAHTAARLERRIDWLLDDNRPLLRHAAVMFTLLLAALVALRPELAAPTFTTAASIPADFDEGCDEAAAALQCGP